MIISASSIGLHSTFYGFPNLGKQMAMNSIQADFGRDDAWDRDDSAVRIGCGKTKKAHALPRVLSGFSLDSRRRSLHEEVRRATKGVVGVLDHAGRDTLRRIDHVLRVIDLVGLDVCRHSVPVATAPSAALATLIRAGVSILADIAACAVHGVRLIPFGVIAFRSGVEAPFVTEVMIAGPGKGFEIMVIVSTKVRRFDVFSVARGRPNDGAVPFGRLASNGGVRHRTTDRKADGDRGHQSENSAKLHVVSPTDEADDATSPMNEAMFLSLLSAFWSAKYEHSSKKLQTESHEPAAVLAEFAQTD